MTAAATKISLEDSWHRHVSLSFRAARRDICAIFIVEKVKPDSNDNILFLPGVTCLGWSYDHYTQLRTAIAGISIDQQREGDHKTTQRLSFLKFQRNAIFIILTTLLQNTPSIIFPAGRSYLKRKPRPPAGRNQNIRGGNFEPTRDLCPVFVPWFRSRLVHVGFGSGNWNSLSLILYLSMWCAQKRTRMFRSDTRHFEIFSYCLRCLFAFISNESTDFAFVLCM